jgi:hypothetical protein
MVNSADKSDDLYDYIEFLQSQLHSAGWEEFHDVTRMKKWYAENAARFDHDLVPQYGSIGSPSAHMERLVADFEPKTRFDSPLTEATFGPVLREVEEAAKRIGITLKRTVQLLTSTNVGATPIARPTEGPHYLFIGLGTSSFCNYWSKTFTAVLRAVPNEDPPRRISQRRDLENVFKSDPSGLLLATRLAFAYGVYGSVIGFGKIIQPESYHGYRILLLQAMEIFVVAHEFAHFIVAERTPAQSSINPEASRNLEYLCDHLALQISREFANVGDNWLAFTGIGAIVFFRAMEMSEFAREQIAFVHQASRSVQNDKSTVDHAESTHPSLAERIARIEALTIQQTAADQHDSVASFVKEYAIVASALSSMVAETLRSALSPA